MRNWVRIAILLTTIFACVGCDQATKSAARLQLTRGSTISLFHDCVRLQRLENPGAFLSMGDSLPKAVRTALFTLGGILLVGSALLWAALSRRMNRIQTVGVALICSGGVGNLIDRLTRGGSVTDFLNVGVGSLRTGIFNIADFCLLVGLVIFVLSASGQTRHPARL